MTTLPRRWVVATERLYDRVDGGTVYLSVSVVYRIGRARA
jgi:hypothetical protein